MCTIRIKRSEEGGCVARSFGAVGVLEDVIRREYAACFDGRVGFTIGANLVNLGFILVISSWFNIRRVENMRVGG